MYLQLNKEIDRNIEIEEKLKRSEKLSIDKLNELANSKNAEIVEIKKRNRELNNEVKKSKEQIGRFEQNYNVK